MGISYSNDLFDNGSTPNAFSVPHVHQIRREDFSGLEISFGYPVLKLLQTVLVLIEVMAIVDDPI